MSEIWLPGDSDFALALREPNLLVPKTKPIKDRSVDWANPLSQGLIVACDFGKGTGRNFETVSSPLNGYIRIVHDQLGVGFSGASGNLSIQQSNNGPYLRFGTLSWEATLDVKNGYDNSLLSSQEATFFVVLRRHSTSSNYFSKFTTSQDSHYPFSGVFYSSIFRANRLTLSGVYSSTLDDNWHSVAITSSSSQNQYKVYTGGQLKYQTTPNWGIPSNSAQTTLLGADDKDVAAFYMWNRALSEAEIAFLEDFPYSLLYTDNSPFLISVPAAGGTPSLSSPGVINVLSDRATPQVTLTF